MSNQTELERLKDAAWAAAGAALEAEAARVAGMVEGELKRLPAVSGGAQLGVSRDLQEVLNDAQKEADRLKDEYISTEHLLLALATASSPAKEVLSVLSVKRDALLTALVERVADAGAAPQWKAESFFRRFAAAP